MVVGLGIDIVEIARFTEYQSKNRQSLSRIFSINEIDYCLKEPAKSAERFAARFAAKEALYKALTQALGKPPYPFLTLCRHCSIEKNGVLPVFVINWQKLGLAPMFILVTLSHAQKSALAQVILQKI